jgi:hypothetical protein
MIENEYEKLKFQKKLIDQFTEEFNRHLGYRPIVVTKTTQKASGPLELMSLTELKDYFEPFLPTLYDKKVPLDAKCRIREIIELRQMYFYLARSMGYKLVFIAYSLGKKDHTTVVHALNTFHNLLEVDEGYKNRFLTILNYIKSLKNGSPALADSDKVQDNA